MSKIIDEALNEPATPAPAAFDMAAYLSGLAPARAEYPLGPGRIPLVARTADWSAELIEQMKDADGLEQDLAWIHGHIVDDAITIDELRHLHAVALPEYRELFGLVRDLDLKPRAYLSPRFLPAASD